MKILFTGASSFTGYWFAKTLSNNGHHVISTLLNNLDFYSTGIRSERVKRLKDIVEIVDGCKFGEKKFMELIASEEFDVLCHHAAYVTGYRNTNFDVTFAIQNNTNNLQEVLLQMTKKGLKAVVLTGSVFEANEGAGELPLRAFSPYGLSKSITSAIFEFRCSELKLPFGKFVIANPFGPFEELKFCSYLINTWKNGNVASVKTPLYVRDNIHVMNLGTAYNKFINQVITQNSYIKINPSGYIGSQGDFALKFAREMQPRIKLACDIEFETQTTFEEPQIRINTDPVNNYIDKYNDSIMWDNLAYYYNEFYLQ